MAQPGMPRRLAPMALLTGAPGAAAPAVVAQAAAAQQTLSLTGQRRPLPLTIHAATAIVHLNACELADGDLDAHLVQAQAPGSVRHIGLAYNPLICSLKTLAPAARFPALVSLDVAFCGLADLSELAHLLHPLPLKSLVAAGNPLALLPCYRPYLISSLSSLEFLDDRRVSHHQHRLLTNFAAASDATAAAQVTISLGRIASLPPPPENDFTCTDPAPGADPPSDSTFSVSYSVGFDMPGRLAHLQPDGAPDSSNGTANAVADHLAALSSEDPSNFPSPAEPAHPRPAFQSASFPWAAEGVTSGHIWQLLVDDLPALKEALAAGIELSLFKTVVESVSVHAEGGERPPSRSTNKKGQGKKAAKEQATVERRDLPPVV